MARLWPIVAGVVAVLMVVGFATALRDDAPSSPPGAPAAEQPEGGRLTPADSVTTTTLNLYAGQTAGRLSPTVADHLSRVYVPNGLSNTVTVIDPATFEVIQTFSTSAEPQHVVPAHDLQRLWVLDNQGDDLIPIDPRTGEPGTPVAVEDPYNLYFLPDGSEAMIVAEALQRLDFRDPQTMAYHRSIETPTCPGINHVDFAADESYLVATCEFGGALVKVDWRAGVVLATLALGDETAMPQDIRLSPDGSRFYVAEMTHGGVYVVDAATFTLLGFIPTGVGAHGLTPSRDGTKLYVANRGSTVVPGGPGGAGSVTVLDAYTGEVLAQWALPGGGSPDMGNLSTDGSQLWLSGRYDDEVYVFDTTSGALLARIPVGDGPHGLAYWPQPGRYSLGHTGNMR